MNQPIIAPCVEVAPTTNQGTIPDDTPLQTRGHPNIKSNFDKLIPDINGPSHENPLVIQWNLQSMNSEIRITLESLKAFRARIWGLHFCRGLGYDFLIVDLDLMFGKDVDAL